MTRMRRALVLLLRMAGALPAQKFETLPLTPPMGRNLNEFGCNIDEGLIRQAVDSIRGEWNERCLTGFDRDRSSQPIRGGPLDRELCLTFRRCFFASAAAQVQVTVRL